MSMKGNKMLVLVVVVAAIALLLWSLSSCKPSNREGYLAAPYGSIVSQLFSPVNNMSNYAYTPSLQMDPLSKYKPLDVGQGVDFYPDLRKLGEDEEYKLFDDINYEYDDRRGNQMLSAGIESTPSYNLGVQAIRFGDMNTFRRLHPIDVAVSN